MEEHAKHYVVSVNLIFITICVVQNVRIYLKFWSVIKEILPVAVS